MTPGIDIEVAKLIGMSPENWLSLATKIGNLFRDAHQAGDALTAGQHVVSDLACQMAGLLPALQCEEELLATFSHHAEDLQNLLMLLSQQSAILDRISKSVGVLENTLHADLAGLFVPSDNLGQTAGQSSEESQPESNVVHLKLVQRAPTAAAIAKRISLVEQNIDRDLEVLHLLMLIQQDVSHRLQAISSYLSSTSTAKKFIVNDDAAPPKG